MSGGESVAGLPRLSPLPRQRRRDFKTPNRPTLKGRSLLLQDSDDEGDTRSTLTSQPQSAPAVPEISFQDIISNLVLEDQGSPRGSDAKTNSTRPYSTDVSSLSKDSAHWQASKTARDLFMGDATETRSLVDNHRRHSVTPSFTSAASQRQSIESPARTPLKNGSFVSLIDTQGLEKEDLDMLRMLKRRQAILRELVTTELSFSQDLAVIVQEYQQNTDSCSSLTAEDVRQIFDGVGPVMTFSHDLAFELQLAAAPVLFSEALQMQTLHHEDSRTTVGAVFMQNIGRLSKVFARYCSTHESAAACLQRVSRDSSVQTWLSQRHPTDRTTAWDLPSLLIKPVQRIMKYPLLLSTLIDATSRTHPDYEAISFANREMLATAENINNIKKRRDLVGQIAAEGRKNDGGVIAKTFQRRNTKVRALSIAPTEEQPVKTDPVFDRLSKAFRAQEAVLQSLKLDIQDWLATMSSALDYHASLAASFADVLACGSDSDGLGVSKDEVDVSWQGYVSAVSDLQQGAIVELGHNLKSEVVDSLSAMQDRFLAPGRVLDRRDSKVEDFSRAQMSRDRGLPLTPAQSEAADEYLQLNETLKQELPPFLAITERALTHVVRRFAALQSDWYRAWHMRFSPLLSRDAVESELLAHFRLSHALLIPRMAELDLINGTLAESNRLDTVNGVRTSEDNSSTSDASTKVNPMSRPTIRNRAFSAANNAAISLKQMSMVRSPSGSTTPTLLSTKASNSNLSGS